MDNEHAAGAPGEREDGRTIERGEPAQVEYRGFDAIGRQPLGHAHRGVHVGAVRHDRQAIARASKRGAADRSRRRRLGGHPLFDPRIAVERDVFVVEHGIRIRDGRRHHRAGVERRGRHDDLQTGRPVEPGLGVLRVVRTGVAQTAPRHPHDHRDAAAPAVPDLRGIVHQLVESCGDEVVELHLADGPKPGERRAHARAEHGTLGERGVDDAVPVLLEQRSQQQKRVAVPAADILADDEGAGVRGERVADAVHDGVKKSHALLVERRRVLDGKRRWDRGNA